LNTIPESHRKHHAGISGTTGTKPQSAPRSSEPPGTIVGTAPEPTPEPTPETTTPEPPEPQRRNVWNLHPGTRSGNFLELAQEPPNQPTHTGNCTEPLSGL